LFQILIVTATKPPAKVGGFFYPVNFNYFGYAGSVDAPNLVQLSGRRLAGRENCRMLIIISQVGRDIKGNLIAKGDIVKQTEQAFKILKVLEGQWIMRSILDRKIDK
jgi:enamine deaminase RidA (YjgF/YER057c/UK114 family)